MVYSEQVSPVAIPFIVDYLDGIPNMLLAARLKDGYATTPGGQIRSGESARKAARREIKEETDLNVSPHEILTVSHHPILTTVEGVRISASTFLVYYKEHHGKPKVKEPDKHSPWVWAPLEVVDKELAHHWLFPYEVFFAGNWQEKVYKHGKRLKLL